MEVDKTLNVSDHDVWINDFMRGDKTYLGREPQRRAVERWCQQHDSQCETERQERPHRGATYWRTARTSRYLDGKSESTARKMTIKR